MKRWVLLALLLGCDQEGPAAPVPDAGADASADATAPTDAGRPVGAPCQRSADCQGACLPDAVSGALRCHLACDDPACPQGARCVEGDDGEAGCVAAVAGVGDGDPCGIDQPCMPPLVCHAAGAENRCAPACTEDADCPPDRRCQAGACLAAGAPTRCPELACLRPDLVCDAGTCVALCADAGEACAEGGTCGARAGDGARVCRPDGLGDVGSPCASGGDAACRPGLTCLARGPGDPAAVCTRACAAEPCEEGLACRRPEGFPTPYCWPAPFGEGDATGEAGADCTAHGATDCLPALDCVPGPAGRRECAAPCADGCAAPRVCDDRGPTPHCRPRDALGLPCQADADCPAVCLPGQPEDRYCTGPCADGCPAGAVCAATQAGEVCVLAGE
ncbi:MAG: hypothetical protein H6706_16270 [Myxococcales bacterium]|nr:hypothetical protein [Myxococcales bacterium]